MAHYDLKTEQLKEMAPKLRAGDTVTLTGTVYTARDAAHKKIVAAMDAGDKLPFDLDGAAKAASIKNVEVIAYDELGCESVKRLTVENFSAIVSQDSVGGNLYTEGVAKYKKD